MFPWHRQRAGFIIFTERAVPKIYEGGKGMKKILVIMLVAMIAGVGMIPTARRRPSG
jgi:hypothetical protein